jgi:polyhydroxyalkanoate synthase
MASVPNRVALLDRIRADVERNTLRARNGLRHLAGVGRPEVGSSAKDVVWRRDKVQLYRYHSDQRRLGPPILLVMSLVSKPYVLDLRPGNSFVEALVDRGFDVYMLDWGTPDATEADNSFETYCDEYIPFACAAVMRTSGTDDLHVFGYCFGGVLSLIFAAGHPEIPLRTLSLMATPVDFAAMGGMTSLLRDERVQVDDFLDETGNVPAEAVLRGLTSSRVTGDATMYASLLENLQSSDYIAAHQAMHGWASDHIPFPGACFRQTAQWLIRDNRLAENTLVTDRGPLDLASITCPVMNSVGTADHLIPMESNRPIIDLIPHLDQMEFQAGHVGLIIGGKAHRVSIPAMADWLEQHSDRTAP